MRKILCWGGDRRMVALAQWFNECGISAMDLPADEEPDFSQVDALVLPVPTLSSKTGHLSGKENCWSEQKLIQAIPQSFPVMAYLNPDQRKMWQDLRPDLSLLNLGEDETFLYDNSVISAEGAIVQASPESGECLSGKHCLVLGYGRLGEELTRMLLGLGARVSVAGRSGGSLKKAFFRGLDAWDFDGWHEVLPQVDWIFNTIPSRILGAEELDLLKKDCYIMELASAPYGLDERLARQRGIAYLMEISIPGRLYPVSAAKAMARAWLRAFGSDKEEDET